MKKILLAIIFVLLLYGVSHAMCAGTWDVMFTTQGFKPFWAGPVEVIME